MSADHLHTTYRAPDNRFVRCSAHGLALAPDGKCVRCRREEASALADAEKTARPTRGPLVFAALVGAFAVAVLLAFAVRPQRMSTPAPAPASAERALASSAPPLMPMVPASVTKDPAAPRAAASSATPLERAMHTVPIKLYCRPASPDCARSRTWLLDQGYVYKELDVDADTNASLAAHAIASDGAVPAFDIDGQTFAGFDAARLHGALEYAGARRLQR